jgi:hypothetical protein
MDQNDLFTFFMTLKKQYAEEDIPRILEMYEITKLDVNRIYRYLDKYMEKSVVVVVDNEDNIYGGELDNQYDSVLLE